MALSSIQELSKVLVILVSALATIAQGVLPPAVTVSVNGAVARPPSSVSPLGATLNNALAKSPISSVRLPTPANPNPGASFANAISNLFQNAERQAEREGGPAAPPAPPSHTSTVEDKLPPATGTHQSCHAFGRLPEEPAFKTKLNPKRRCRRGWSDFPDNTVILPNNHKSYPPLKAKGVIDDAMEVIGLADLVAIPGKGSVAQNLAVSTWTGQMHSFIHSKRTIGNSEATDRMLRMSSGQMQAFIVVNEVEASALTKEWMQKVSDLFRTHPKLGILGGHAGIKGGKAYSGTQGQFEFVEMVVGGPIAVRREAYFQASVYLSSSETCGPRMAECMDPAQPLSQRIWAAGFQAGILPVVGVEASKPQMCPEILNVVDKSTVRKLVEKGSGQLRARQGTGASVASFSTTCTCSKHGPDDSRVTAVIQYFKRKSEVRALAASLNLATNLDVIINDDSMSEGDLWLNSLTGNAFVAYFHNMHEIRGYNRLTRFANTDYVAEMQDDDIPKDGRWPQRAVSLFNAHPRLAMLGGFRGRMDVGKRFDKSTGQMWGKKFGPRYLPIPLHDTSTKILYMPCYKVNAAPLVLDRRVFAELGGFNNNFSCVGESGIDFDFEYSIRLWKTGYEVGLTEFRFRHGAMDKSGDASKSGTRADKKKWDARRNAERFNNAQLYAMYKDFHHKTGTATAMRAFSKLMTENKEERLREQKAAKRARGK